MASSVVTEELPESNYDFNFSGAQDEDWEIANEVVESTSGSPAHSLYDEDSASSTSESSSSLSSSSSDEEEENNNGPQPMSPRSNTWAAESIQNDELKKPWFKTDKRCSLFCEKTQQFEVKRGQAVTVELSKYYESVEMYVTHANARAASENHIKACSDPNHKNKHHKHCVMEILDCPANYGTQVVHKKGWMVKVFPNSNKIDLLMTCNSTESQNVKPGEGNKSYHKWILNIDTPDGQHAEIPFQVFAMMRSINRHKKDERLKRSAGESTSASPAKRVKVEPSIAPPNPSLNNVDAQYSEISVKLTEMFKKKNEYQKHCLVKNLNLFCQMMENSFPTFG